MDQAQQAPLPYIHTVSQHRANYEFIMAQCREAGLENALAFPGYLRSEVPLNQGQSCDFSLLANQSSDGLIIGGTERRLQQNDAFFVTHMAVMLYSVPGTTAAGAPATNAQRAPVALQQYANANAFGLNTPSALAFFNGGALTIKQNDTIYVRDLDLYSMQYTDTAQQSATVVNAFDFERSFRAVADPMFRLNGQSNIEANIQFPAPLNFTLVATTTVYAVLYLKGWRVQNAGVARSAKK